MSAPSERSRIRCSGAGELRCVLVLMSRHTCARSESPYTAFASGDVQACMQGVDDGGRRIGGDERAVDRADGGAGDDIGADAGLEERLDHADLDRAANAAAAEHERDGRVHCTTTRPPSG